jgi:spore maturation protein CgeB
VKRNSDIENFKSHGAKRVIVNLTGFYPAVYHPHRLTEVPSHLKHDTVFIGTAIDHRVGSIAYLMNKENLRIDVYGGLWNRHLVYYRHRQYFHGFSGLAYSLIVSGSKVCLGYVSSSNLDEYTQRSFEIPACGGFFLAERTPTHQELYREGEEAEFFGSDEECAEKIRFYLRNDSKRQKIAQAGYERCFRSDYSLIRSMREAMREIFALRND